MATAPADPPAGMRPRRRARLSWLLLGLLVAAIFLGPWLLMGLAIWAADGPWTFEGSGIAHRLLVRGSHLDRLGEVQAAGPVRYSVSLRDGTFPGWRIASYPSRAEPADVAATYADRCRAYGFRITRQTQETQNASRAVLVCEIEPDLDVEVAAEATPGTLTAVSLKVWGAD